MEDNTYTSDFQSLTDDSGFVKDVNDSIIKVIGVGGGGCNAVKYMYEQNIPNVSFVVCNTDQQHLQKMPIANKLLIGFDVTGGRGAGNRSEVGKMCAEASEEDIRKLFDDQTEMVFITAGMGGGTGTGAAPVVARIAKDCGLLTIGIVTVPFFFEGEKKILTAIEGAKELQKYVDALLVINNENIIDLYPDYNLFNAFHKSDDTLANAARSISEIISESCYINVDFQDVKTTLKDSGSAIISTAIGEGEHRISKAIDSALHSPLLKKHDIYSSKRLLLKFVCWKDSENPLRAEEIAEITQFTSKLPPSIEVKWGIGDDPALEDKVKITVLASGFDFSFSDSDEPRPVPIPTNDDKGGKIPFIMGEEDAGVKILADNIEKKEAQSAIADVYGKQKAKELFRANDEMKYVVLKPSQFDDFEAIQKMTSTPAFGRSQALKDEINNMGSGTDKKTSQKSDSSKEIDRGATPITF